MKKILLLIVGFGLIFSMVACQKSQEITVTKYFQAISHNDNDTMSSMAVEPKFIEFKSQKIISASEPVLEEYMLPVLIQKMDAAKKERKNLAITAGEKRDEVEELKDELSETRRSSKKRELEKQIEDAEVEFYKAEQDFRNLVKDMGELKKKIEMERNQVSLATGIKKNAETYTGQLEKTIVKAEVTLPDDSKNIYIFTLIRYNFIVNKKTLPSRWAILKIQSEDEFQKEAQMTREETPAPTEEVSEETPAEEKDEQ
ncbi:MAG: hypothetical protein KAT17_07160 [Candidatus Aminicenantes bacterium]|nr:hypothetical protein [Candidatus Aminicenantes bacterium]